MMTTWPQIPSDVISWFRRLFSQINRRVSETILNFPSVRETTLDDEFIQAVVPHSAPKRLESGAIVRVDIHNIGGLRRVSRWEIGDIGILVFVIQKANIIARKVAVLQAKRLYPTVGDVQDDDPMGFYYGMNAFLRGEESPTSMILTKTFEFDDKSVYGQLRANSEQQSAIESFEQKFGSSVYYLLYNPPAVPLRVNYPIVAYRKIIRRPELGVRLAPAAKVHQMLNTLTKGEPLKFRDFMSASSPNGGWRLERWAADLLLSCREGRRFSSPDEGVVQQLLERRSGPIGAAMAVSIELPDRGA
jgi:hypothetical protein